MATHDIVIRESVAADIPTISSLCRAVFVQVYGRTVSQTQLESDLEAHYGVKAVEADFNHPDKTQLVACKSSGDQVVGEVLGLALLTRYTDATEPALPDLLGRPWIELERLYIAVNYQDQGIGSALMRAVEQEAGKQGFGGVWLGVWEANQRAIGFYEKVGFEKVGEHDWGSQNDWIMVKYTVRKS